MTPALSSSSRLFESQLARLRTRHPQYFWELDAVDPYCATPARLEELIGAAPTNYWRGLLTAHLLVRLQTSASRP